MAYLTAHSPYTPVMTSRVTQVHGSQQPALAFVPLTPADCTDSQRFLEEWADSWRIGLSYCEDCPESTWSPAGADGCVPRPALNFTGMPPGGMPVDPMVIVLIVGVGFIVAVIAALVLLHRLRRADKD
eukprot:gene38116-47449_t